MTYIPSRPTVKRKNIQGNSGRKIMSTEYEYEYNNDIDQLVFLVEDGYTVLR